VVRPGDRRVRTVLWPTVGETDGVQLFQRRRWLQPERVDEGLRAFSRQLAWINDHTGLEMDAWRRSEGDEPGAILATTTYVDHAWFLAEVARLQTLPGYGPVNDATAVLTVGEDAFERWDSPVDLPENWALGDSFMQLTVPDGTPSPPDGAAVWNNVEGAEGQVARILDSAIATEPDTVARRETWSRLD